jgi:small subunit ribosomal protein S16
MPVKIRLMRIGTNNRPFYRVVAVDERKKRTGGYLELLGTYNPLTEPKEINLDQGKIDAWMKKGAQPSEGFLRIIGKAPQRPPRKPKKAPKEAPAAPTPAAESATETPAAEAPVEEATVPSETAEQTTPESAAEAPVVLEEKTEEAPAEEVAAVEPETKPEEAEKSEG